MEVSLSAESRLGLARWDLVQGGVGLEEGFEMLGDNNSVGNNMERTGKGAERRMEGASCSFGW